MHPERYIRQLALPQITPDDQKRLKDTHIAIIGAGGLGSAALPYLASAGIGRLTIYDHDTISISNLHRQTIYKDVQAGQNKADRAAAYCQDLNPEIVVTSAPIRFEESEGNYDILFDGSDNFETKTLLNEISLKTKTPLISASVNQWAGQIGIFAGYAQKRPCYHCLFPELPKEARNCNEAGILGTAAGITGMYQAHVTLCYLLALDGYEPGRILSFDFLNPRLQNLFLNKDEECAHCSEAQDQWIQRDKTMADLISMAELSQKDHIIVDVRTDLEVANDPVPGNVIHMELQSVPSRHEELPKDKLLAFVCAGNIRSVQAAEYLEGLGYTNICVLDKFSI